MATAETSGAKARFNILSARRRPERLRHPFALLPAAVALGLALLAGQPKTAVPT